MSRIGGSGWDSKSDNQFIGKVNGWKVKVNLEVDIISLDTRLLYLDQSTI